MQPYDRFIFESYKFDPETRQINLHYSLNDALHFTETITLPAFEFASYDSDALDRALFAVHLAGGASYFKTYCPKTIEVRSGTLNAQQSEFWNTLYTHGLGEFFYVNKIDFRGLINFPITSQDSDSAVKASLQAAPVAQQSSNKNQTATTIPQRALVAFGGGKDSIVTTELLRQRGIDQTLFRVRPHPLITDLSRTAALPLLELNRDLDPQLHELTKQGALNGHVPITAYITFVSIATALLGGFDSVFFSNERSSSYGNVEYLGMQVNHQWSKSLHAERLLRDYLDNFVTRDVQYLNILRPLSELHIARIFVQHPQYFSQATSCNVNWGIAARDPSLHHWCGHCPKCAFSFALLAAYLPTSTVVNIFQKNLFEDKALLGLYRQLWDVEGFKPFECVGTPQEAKAAFYLACKKPDYTATFMGQYFAEHILPDIDDPQAMVDELLTPNMPDASPAAQALLEGLV